MAMSRLPQDFSEFLKLLNSSDVEYLLVGGYAVNYYGLARSTGDMDIWIRPSYANAEKLVQALKEFGFSGVTPDLFTVPAQVIRMGVPPLRLKILTSVSGVDFEEFYTRRQVFEMEDLSVPVISLEDLKHNKRASGRLKDLADLEALD